MNKVYLAEAVIVEEFDESRKMEPLGIFTSLEDAKKTVEVHADANGERGLVTELEIDKNHPLGIGSAPHWHLTGEDHDVGPGWH